MKTLCGGQAAIASLQAERVGHVFGLIGSATMEMFDALYDAEDIAFVGVHDERTGTHMADGYARASGRPGVILAGQNGPGATNLVTGLGQAAAAFSPVVSIAGALSSAHVYRDAFQEVDQDALFRPVTKKTWPATSTDRVPEMFREAFRSPWRPGADRCNSTCRATCSRARPSFRSFRRPRLTAPRPFPRARPRPSRRPPNGSAAPPPGHRRRRRHQEHRRPRGGARSGRSAERPNHHRPRPR